MAIKNMWCIIIRFNKERNIAASLHMRKNPIVVIVLNILDKRIPVLFFDSAKYIYITFMAKPGRRTNWNQIKSLVLKFAPKISETNFGKKNPNNAPEATPSPSKKANIKRL